MYWPHWHKTMCGVFGLQVVKEVMSIGAKRLGLQPKNEDSFYRLSCSLVGLLSLKILHTSITQSRICSSQVDRVRWGRSCNPIKVIDFEKMILSSTHRPPISSVILVLVGPSYRVSKIWSRPYFQKTILFTQSPKLVFLTPVLAMNPKLPVIMQSRLLVEYELAVRAYTIGTLSIQITWAESLALDS